MKIFEQLKKKGYKHYYSGTIEELDDMDRNNPDLHSEIMQVIMWLYEKHGIWISVDIDINGKFRHIIRKYNSNDRAWEVKNNFSISEYYNSPTAAYEAAIEYTLKNLIK